MKHFITALIAAVALVPCFAGEAYDLGERRTVPDWAVGPLLVVPIERVQDRRLNVPRSETRRIGTLQANYVELSGQRHRLASIRLFEVPNDGYSCSIKTVPNSGRYFEIHVSQSLYDQTFYYFYVRTMQVGSDEPIEKQNYAVWDAKSRK
jgi:hypothetical protein